MKKWIKLFAWSIAFLLLLGAGIFLVAWKSPKYYVVHQFYPEASLYLPFSRYTGEHVRPFVVYAKNVVVFGAEHTRDTKDPQLGQLEREWKTLQPTVALVEGRLGFLLPGLMDPVKTLGEGGKLKALAQQDNIPIYNWDLSKETLAVQLQKHFSKEQIALYLILNPYFSNLRFGKPAQPEAFIKTFLKRAAYVGLENTIKSTEDVDRIWKRYFPGKDWRNVSDETVLPGYLDELMRVTNDLRNQQLISVVKELQAKGERVFAVCGSSHAFCIAPAF